MARVIKRIGTLFIFVSVLSILGGVTYSVLFALEHPALSSEETKGRTIDFTPIPRVPIDQNLSYKDQLALRKKSFQTFPAFLVSTGWLHHNIGDPNLVILHVSQGEDHYLEEHIPTARFVDWNDLIVENRKESNQMPPVEKLEEVFRSVGVNNTSKVVLYGDNKGISAARAYVVLDYLGHAPQTAMLDGGLELWHAEFRRTNRVPFTDFSPGTFAANVNENVLVTFEDVREAMNSNKTILLDSREPEQFTGKKAGEGIRRSGHIPSAVNVPQDDMLASVSVPYLKQIDEIEDMFFAKGIADQKQVITYCRTGRQASLSYFTAKMLGYDVRLYDGSYEEWSSKPDAPVATGE